MEKKLSKEEKEALYMTCAEVQEYLGVSKRRVYSMLSSGLIETLKGSVFDADSVEAYKLKRGDKKGGRYPKK